MIELPTPHGVARAHLTAVAAARAALVLGHGAGGGISAPDLTTAAAAAHAQGITVVLVEQPYRVAGRRSPAPAHQLDAAWLAVIATLREKQLRGLPLIVGGRSSGARVACRTAETAEAAGVLCLAFPLQPPRRAGATPAASRQPELDAVTVPMLVVQGARDPFGMPRRSKLRTVVEVDGDHSLRTDRAAVSGAVTAWLRKLLAAT
jgi:hypothetical protein